MRKILSLFAAILFAGSMMADSFTITFKDSGGNSDLTNSLTSTNVADYVASGADYVSAIAPSGKVYLGKSEAGLKFGNSSNGGSVTLTLAAAIKPTSIVVSASQFGASEGSGLFQGQTFDMTAGGGKYSFNDYTVTYDGNTEVETISVGTAKRGYVKSITVNYTAGGGEDPEPTTKTLYCKVAQSWWTADGAAVGIYAFKGEGESVEKNAGWPGVRMTLAENETDVWTATIDAKYEKVIFVRVNASGDIADWGAKTADLVLADAGENDLYTITSTTPVWGDPGVTGAWSKYEYVAPQPAAKFYITGTAALVGEELQWNPAAIKSTEDSYELSLKAGKEYRMKITVDGTWETAKGIGDLTEKAAGLIDMNGNIGFSLKEDGKVKVTYTGAVFKLEGNFVESPIAKTYFATTSGWTEDAESNVVVNADKSLTVNIVKGKEAAWQAQIHYQAPVAKAGKVYDLSIKFKATNAINGVIVKYQDNKEMLFDDQIALEKDVELAYAKTGLVGQDGGNGILVFDFGYAPANTVVTISAITITEKDAPAPVVLEDGFYLIGKIGGVAGWDEAGLKAEHKFGPNLENPVEFMLNVTLAENDEIQVVNVLSNAITAWFPGGDGNNFVITAAYAGAKTIYFRPDKQGGEGWHHGCIYIEKNQETAISNAVVEGKAQKVMMGGQLFILRDGKTYNIQGKEVK